MALPETPNNEQTKETYSMKHPMRQILFTALAVILLLAACAPAAAPTTDPQEVANMVATSVALTVASQNLDTAEAVPPATETPLPTATAAVVDTPTTVLPLDTPTAIPLPSATAVSSGGGGGGGTTTQSEYSCDIIRRRPADNTIYKPNDRVDIKWTIINNGTRTMRAGLDLKFSNGDRLMSDRIVELPELGPGDQFEVGFDATAPERPGTYIMVYMVEGGLCYPYVAITVER
jgi:hypothetical protein